MAECSLVRKEGSGEGPGRGVCSFLSLFLRMGETLEAERQEPKESGGNWGSSGDGSVPKGWEGPVWNWGFGPDAELNGDENIT